MNRSWRLPQSRWTFDRPRLMGIVNVTPDSFSDGGRWDQTDAAVEQALSLVEQGADLLDVGGESTRPGSLPVSEAEELRRVLPVIERIAAKCSVPVSIDTSKATVARHALQAGARIVNDVTALVGDPDMPDVCAASDCGVVIMHMQGTPQTMQTDPRYGDVVGEVTSFLGRRLAELQRRGIDPDRVVVDPGIGFGKTAAHNLELLRGIPALHELGRPVLIGHSRKGFLKKLLGRPVEERLAGTIGVSIAVAERGAELIRVHDVQAVRDALAAWAIIRNADIRLSDAAGG
jgi:dihydropteroate synthase